MRSKTGFTATYKENYDMIHRFVSQRVTDTAAADDIVGDVFYKAWRSRNSYRPQTNARAWLFQIARHTVIDYWRRTETLPLDDENLPDESSEPVLDRLERQDTHDLLLSALDTLPGQMKSVLLLRFIEELPAKEVGRLLGISAGNVRVIQLRALRRLRDEMSGGQDG